MTLRNLLKQDFGVDLPISGGFGNSIDNPVIIERSNGINDYASTEYFILKCLAEERKIKWKTIGQECLTHRNRKIDRIKIEVALTTPIETITTTENYYFDITDCCYVAS